VVYALATAVRSLTGPGESVLIQPPVYYPFYEVIRDNDRKMVKNDLVYENGRYHMDFADLEEKIREHNVKLLLLCSPHNPVGRVWTREELKELGRICKEYKVIVASDEIHCDFTLPGHPHTIFADACPELLDQLIICTAPSKTFNLAGLQVSNIWIPNPDIRGKFRKEMDRSGYSQLNTLGLVGAKAAYEKGEEWLDQCKDYLRGNLDFLREYLSRELPQIRLVEPDGTYFAWLDCSRLGLSCKELNDRILYKAGLWLDGGYIFGECGEQFQRVVLACTRKTLQEALERLKKVLDS
jgi:cystathionine beta-lyase